MYVLFILYHKVKSTDLRESGNLVQCAKSLDDLVNLISTTHVKYDEYLTPNLNNTANLNQYAMWKEIYKCQQEYDTIVSNSTQIVSNNNNVVSLNYSMSDIKQIIENKLVQIKTTQQNSNQLLKKIASVEFYQPKYSICQFDLKYTKLSDGSTIDCDNKHIKIGSKNDWCYSMILPDKEHVQGYSSGQHCFRMYYKNPKGPHYWLLFGIYKYGIVPKDMSTYYHETSWGIADDTNGTIYCNGKYEYDKSNMSFLYSLNENQIDMLIDFDNGILSYSIVDDNVKNRKYTFKETFNTINIAYTVHLNLYCAGTQVQIAKINVDMFGKNKKLVKWSIEKY